MLAIDKEMDNLRAHDAFHYVPVKEALAQGKKIMRMTWVFKIKTLSARVSVTVCRLGAQPRELAVCETHSNGWAKGCPGPYFE